MFKKTLKKNWPGGRRNATTIHTDQDHSYPVWNTEPVAFKKPYITVPEKKD